MKRIKILFRSCVPIERLSLMTIRPFGLKKREIVLKCLISLLESCLPVKNRVSVEIIDDSSGDQFISEVNTILNRYPFGSKVHENNFSNNGMSLEYSYGVAEKAKEDIIYFCEDDYLHLKETIPYCLDSYDDKIIGHSEFGIFPTDYPDWYHELFPSYIFISKHIHWRSVDKTTGTFIITKNLFKENKKFCFDLADYNKTGRGGEHKTINKMWNTVPCIAPIPSLTAHLNDHTLPPLIDWKRVSDSIKI